MLAAKQRLRVAFPSGVGNNLVLLFYICGYLGWGGMWSMSACPYPYPPKICINGFIFGDENENGGTSSQWKACYNNMLKSYDCTLNVCYVQLLPLGNGSQFSSQYVRNNLCFFVFVLVFYFEEMVHERNMFLFLLDFEQNYYSLSCLGI